MTIEEKFYIVMAHFSEAPRADKLHNTGLLINLIETLNKNFYLSYSPNTKKWRVRIWEYSTIDGKENPNTYIYNKSKNEALLEALYREIK